MTNNDSGPAGEFVADDTYSVNVQINERQFYDAQPQYATIPHVTFDGVNYHLAFFVTAPSPLPIDHEQKAGPLRAQAVARLVMPPAAVLSTIQALQGAFGHVAEDSIFISPVTQEENDHDNGSEL